MSEETRSADHAGEPPNSHPSSAGLRPVVGSAFLFLGLLILGLLSADREGGLPLNMPRSWYSDRSLWVAAGMAALGGGWYLLRDSQPQAADARPGRSAPAVPAPFSEVILYTRAGCHLCDLARETLAKHGNVLPQAIEIDIDQDPALRDQFTDCVPVVRIDGKIRFRGRVNELPLRRLIEGKSAAHS